MLVEHDEETAQGSTDISGQTPLFSSGRVAMGVGGAPAPRVRRTAARLESGPHPHRPGGLCATRPTPRRIFLHIFEHVDVEGHRCRPTPFPSARAIISLRESLVCTLHDRCDHAHVRAIRVLPTLDANP